MGIRYRKSIGLGKGLRLNVSKTGLGVSAGIPGLRYSVHSSGRRTKTVSIPGTGVSHVSTSSSRSRSATRSGGPAATAQPINFDKVLPSAGMFAGAADKRYREGLLAYLAGDKARSIPLFEAVVAADPNAVSAHLFAGIAMSGTDYPDEAQIGHLEAVVSSDVPIPDKLLTKFLPPTLGTVSMAVKISDLVSAEVPIGAVGAALALAECYQEAGRLDEAIGLIQQLAADNPGEPAIALSLADLLFADADYDGVIEVTGGVANQDDVTVELLHIRGSAMFAQGHLTAATDCFRDALAKTAGRDPELLKAVRYDRAYALEAAGQKAKARADFERVYAADPDYLDVRDRLASS